jgi:hypothetical protein
MSLRLGLGSGFAVRFFGFGIGTVLNGMASVCQRPERGARGEKSKTGHYRLSTSVDTVEPGIVPSRLNHRRSSAGMEGRRWTNPVGETDLGCRSRERRPRLPQSPAPGLRLLSRPAPALAGSKSCRAAAAE